ncbi:uncharacterized protein LOC100137637 isoform X1 [Xenopus laevis]|uniref:Uncharacterized protein LOC100137637 isoform X1 n=2 Tax=Xenopus laevis TaxID=8355 RepID=A0A1L8FXN0_XENLA|nr:uncharacterized protein LOC100137637 isoform X1 [Xenopus laevis]XP_018121644.1 uncharacterized protein LOC100137637 isoform X1 [Xenopus laevis]XP_018121646.1 uncharacterized protein LOC100137637 isoform X1 [Xenopus laevis]OCT76346.1 hypothetical protein XELAEV_18031545mg [Xenopus laevis]
MARVPPSQRSSRKNWEQPNSHRASQTNQPKSAHDRRSQASNGRLSQHHKNVRPPTAHSNSRSPVESSSRSRRPSHHLEDKSGKCSQICTIRGILQIVEIMTGILVLICVIASYAVITGYTSAAGFGSFSIDSAYSPFEGNELKQVRDLDMQYSQLRVPGIYGGVPFILLLCGLTIFFLMVGSKPMHWVNIRILFAEFIFDIVACIGYIVAVGLYLHFIKQVNSTDVCKTRERLYAGRGYTWMNCEVQGGDAAVALFGFIAACLYLPSAIMCALYIKTVREFQKNHLTHEYPRNSFKERDHNGSRNPEEELFHPSTFV